MSLRQTTHDPRVQAFMLLVPALAIYAIFALYPMVNVVVLSFQKWNGLDPQRPFVGFANYQAIFTRDPVFWVAFKNTVIWTLMSLVFPPLVGLLLALSLNQKIFGRNGLRAIFYLPVIIDPEYHAQAVNVAAQEQNPSSLLWWMRRLIALRNRYQAFARGELEMLFPENRKVLAFLHEHPALIAGDIEFFRTNEPVLAFRRYDANQSLVCAYNLSPETVKVTLTGEAEMPLSQAAERKKDKLVLGPSGFALLVEKAGAPLRVEFKGRVKTTAKAY